MEQTRQAAGEKAVLAGLDAACFTKEETASEVSLTELQALLETAGGECVNFARFSLMSKTIEMDMMRSME